MLDGKVIVLQSGEEVIISTCGHCNGTGTCTRIVDGHNESSCPDCIVNVFEGYNKATAKLIVKCSACQGKGKVRL